MLSPTIETDRLILRRYKETDLDAMYDIITDKRLSKFIQFPKFKKQEERHTPSLAKQILQQKLSPLVFAVFTATLFYYPTIIFFDINKSG